MNFYQILRKIKTKNRVKIVKKLTIIILAFFIFYQPALATAWIFNPNNIITDEELLDRDSLSQTAIQKFLERENSVLARYSQVIDGQIKKASEIIWEAGQKYGINPRFLLAKLEKEQGLIGKSQATEKALDWATGYSCYGGSCKEKYRGFFNQVEATAETQKIYIQKVSQFSFQVGKTTKTFDGYPVTPENQATANLYIYTPYIGNCPELGISSRFGANYLFWQIWNRYFTYQKYPDGLLIKNNDNYWLIQKGEKRKFKSKEVFLADYKENQAITVSEETLSAYPDGLEINFFNNTLAKSSFNNQAFLLIDGQKRPIVDEEALSLLSDFYLATSYAEIPIVLGELLEPYGLGSPITKTSLYPQGKLFQTQTSEIYLVQDRLKHLVHPLVWQNNYASLPPETTTQEDLSQYPTGSPIKFKDGAFLKNNDKYYLISEGKRMKIDDSEILVRVFGQDKLFTAIEVSQELLELQSAGEVIDYINDTIQEAAVPSLPPSQETGTFQATFKKIIPESLLMYTGEIKVIEIQFQNTGTAIWQKEKVWLEISGKEEQKINFQENQISSNQIATFKLNLIAPNETGLQSKTFTLYYDKDGVREKITSIGKFILTNPATSAELVSHNLPTAVKNNWQPVNIIFKIKNVGKENWQAKSTKLKISNQNNEKSEFYDPNDWLTQEVAAIPINKKIIKPGEIGEFKFTLKVKKLEPGIYYLKIKLELEDKNLPVLLNNQLELIRIIRVDK